MAPQRRPLIERIWQYIEVDDQDCWIWTGYLDKDGYGRASSSRWEEGGHHYRGVHTWVWENANGPIPPGLEPDHLCRVKACCNPDHLEIVPHQVNAERRSAMITACPAGHDYDKINTYITPTGQRTCRKCRYQAKKRHRAKVGRTVSG